MNKKEIITKLNAVKPTPDKEWVKTVMINFDHLVTEEDKKRNNFSEYFIF